MTNEEAIVVLQKIKPIPHRGDSKSTTHILETIALDIAIEALERASCIKEKCAYCPHCEHCDVDDETLAIKTLEQRWIPCTERLPEDSDTYLVTIEYKGEVIGVDVASYSPVDGYIDKHWETFNDWKEDDDSCYHVTAWMPLPSSYQGESEAEE